MNTEKTSNEQLYKIVKDLWDNGETKQTTISERENYYDGIVKNPLFTDQKQTNCNISKQIVEAKVGLLLDIPITIGVTPKCKAITTKQDSDNQRLVADILTGVVKDVFDKNNIDAHKEFIARQGSKSGVGASQIIFDTSENVQGDIKIVDVQCKNMRWDKGANRFDKITFLAYMTEQCPAEVKKQYAKNADGTYDKAKCELIDSITDTKTSSDGIRQPKAQVIAGSTTYGADYMNTYDKTQGLQANKVVKLVVMYLLDGSMSPSKSDDAATELEKQSFSQNYPNGRMIIFSPKSDQRIILEDKAIDDGMKSLGNITTYTPSLDNDIIGKGSIHDIMPIQDRINGAYSKIRELLGKELNTVVIDKDYGVGESDFVNHGITLVENYKNTKDPINLKNDTIQEITNMLAYIEQLKQEARQTAGLNVTTMYGSQQDGVTSGEQVNSLKESPMASVRLEQRIFKQYLLELGEKIITMALKYYNTQRVFNITMGNSEKMVEFNSDANGLVIKLYSDNNEQTIIPIGSDWQFMAEVTNSGDVIRSRQENMELTEKLFSAGVLGDTKDLDTAELFLKSQGIPNYRQYIEIQRQKLANMQPPAPPTIADILNDGIKAKAFADILNSLSGNSKAKGQILQAIGLDAEVDTIDSAPVQEITNRGDINELAVIAPEKVSGDNIKASVAQHQAASVIDTKKGN